MSDNLNPAKLDFLFWPDFKYSPTVTGTRPEPAEFGDADWDLRSRHETFHRSLVHFHCHVLQASGGITFIGGETTAMLPIFDGEAKLHEIQDMFDELFIETGEVSLKRVSFLEVCLNKLSTQSQRDIKIDIKYLKGSEISAALAMIRHGKSNARGENPGPLLLPSHLRDSAKSYMKRVEEFTQNGSESRLFDALSCYTFSEADVEATLEGVPRQDGLIDWLIDEPVFQCHAPKEDLPRWLAKLTESFAAKEDVRQIWHVSLDVGVKRAVLGLVVDADQSEIYRKLARSVKEHVGPEEPAQIFVLPIGAVNETDLAAGSPLLRPRNRWGIPRKIEPPAEHLERVTELLARIPASDELAEIDLLQTHIVAAVRALRGRNYQIARDLTDKIVDMRLAREVLYELHRLVPYVVSSERARWWLGTLGIDPNPLESAIEYMPDTGPPTLPREMLDVSGSEHLLLIFISDPARATFYEGLKKLVTYAVLSVYRKQPSPTTTLHQILEVATSAAEEFDIGSGDITSTPEYLNSISDDLDGNHPAGGLAHQWAKKIFLNPPVPANIYDKEARLFRDFQLQIAVATLVVARCRFGHLPNRTEVEEIARAVNDIAADASGEFHRLQQAFSTGDFEDTDISVENLTAAIYELFEPEYDPGKRITPSVVLLLMFVAIASQVDEAVVRRACAEAVHASARCDAYIATHGGRAGDYVRIFDPGGRYR